MTLESFEEEYIDPEIHPEVLIPLPVRKPKPEFPYQVGKCFKVQPHIPPPADIKTWGDSELEHEDREERETVDPLGRCLLHPPAPGEVKPGEVELKIVSLVQAGDAKGTQLFTIRILNSTVVDLPTDVDILAKVYDPLYFDLVQVYKDPFRYNEYSYGQECAAYNQLGDLQGGIIPEFYGSFTLSLPDDQEKSREVRLILTEIVPGISMDKLRPSDFTQSERKELMKAFVDAETAVYDRSVKHRDLSPRNIMISSAKPLNQDRKVVIIDFGMSWPNRMLWPLENQGLPGVSITPLLRRVEPPEYFESWIDWDWSAWIEHHYEHTRSSITQDMLDIWGPHPNM